jgi:hypothetical protein
MGDRIAGSRERMTKKTRRSGFKKENQGENDFMIAGRSWQVSG